MSTKPPTNRTRTRRRLPPLRSTIFRVAAVSGAAFLVLLGGLSIQMAVGRDPALGPKAQASAKRPVITRRIIRRTVVVRKVQRSHGAGTPAAPSVAPQSAPPAPSPPPAPVVTRVS
jgi:hypothetical protein